MSITIEIYERTGPAGSFTDRLVNNSNWKSESLPDNLYKYYYYPIRIPQSSPFSQYSVPTYIYAKITGTYKQIRRLRWSIDGKPGLGDLRIGQSHVYKTPVAQPTEGVYFQEKESTLSFPCVSTTSPQTAINHLRTLGPNQTYFTNFLITQFYIGSDDTEVGNTEPVEITFLFDEYE